MRLRVAAAALAVAATSIAPEARAAETEWYGWQTIALDASALALVAIGAGADNAERAFPFGVAGYGTYLLGAPIVHVVHDHVGRAFGDLGIRLLAPPLTAIAGLAIASAAAGGDSGTDERVDAALTGTLVGAVVGVLGASALDAGVLAWEDEPAAKAEKKTAARTGPTIAPSVAPTRSGFAAGLTGTF
ncbi:MAG: hypothetical protein KIT84_35760 [Labilithrix sp.]|nr:hypothetical protein [Labilithrix sp.]MCW5816410.1 hypothetical protein [Labilithrix sp.]